MLSGFVIRMLCAVLLAAALGSSAQAKDSGVPIAVDDPEMTAAIAAARETLDNVLERKATGGIPAEALSLKVAIPKEGGGVERIYLNGIVQIDETTFEGLLANDPSALPDMKMGDRYRFTHDQIVDWLFVVNGQMHGSYTLRVMLPKLPKAQADQFRAMLAPLP